MALVATCAILTIAVVSGGGGVRYGIANLIVQMSALVALGFQRLAFFEFWRSAPLALKALVIASLLLPLAHAIPLPPQIWTGLPGREAVVTSFGLIGAQNYWFPLSVDPIRSWVALSGLIVPLAILTIGWSIPREKIAKAAWLIALLGIGTILLGVPQVLSNGAIGLLYPETPMPGVLFGTFANRNSAGVFLVSALSCAALLPPPVSDRRVWMIRVVVCGLLLVGILLTRSRTALVLATIPVILGFVRAFTIYRAQRRIAQRNITSWLIGGGVLLTLVVTIIGATNLGRVNDTFSRFEARTDARIYIWEDAAHSAERYWPIGSGMGTFDEVFQLDESLENITERRAGRAHNDYLEIAIEAGVPGLAIVLGWMLLVGTLMLRLRRSSECWTGLAGASVLLVIALQSMTDYPLRSQAMLATASFAILLLSRTAIESRK